MRLTCTFGGIFLILGFAVAAPAPDSKFTFVELKDKFNHKMSQKFHNSEENVLTLEVGKKKLGGVEFQIADGVMQLGSKMLPNDPEKIENIKVQSKCIKL